MRHSLALLVPILLLAGCPSRTPGGGDHDGPPPCSLLTTLEACAARADCVADQCQLCSCAETFLGCRAPEQSKIECPPVGCAQPLCCTTQNPCPSGICVAPGESAGCGPCFVGQPCGSDDECKTMTGAPMICDLHPCSCDGSKTCVPGCTADADCKEGQICGADHRCAAAPCGSHETPTCPAFFDCTNGGCQRRACNVAADCGGAGYCVDGGCYDAQGMCEFPPP